VSADPTLLLGGFAIAALTAGAVVAAIYIGGGPEGLRRQWRPLLLSGILVAVLGGIAWAAGLFAQRLFAPIAILLALGANVVLFALRRQESAKLSDEERERRRARAKAVRGRIAVLIAIYVLGMVLITFLTLAAAGSR
jgi:hypothetical protein